MDVIFQDIFDKILAFLPQSWKKLAFYAAYFNGSYSMKFYVIGNDGTRRDCFHLEEIDQMQLVRLFMEIDKSLGAEREKTEGPSRWNVMTMVVCSDGTMKSDFDYTEIGENFTVYENEWKNRYL